MLHKARNLTGLPSDGEISDVRNANPPISAYRNLLQPFIFYLAFNNAQPGPERMSRGCFLLLVAAILVTWSDGFANAQQTNNFEISTSLVTDVDTHRGLKHSGEITKAEIKSAIKERMSNPDVKLAAGELRSMLRKNPELGKALKKNQVVEDRGFNLQNPAVVKELKLVGAITVFVVGSYLLARIIGQHT